MTQESRSDEPRSRRKRIIIGALLIGLAVLGIAAALPFVILRPPVSRAQLDAFEARLTRSIAEQERGDPAVADAYRKLIALAVNQDAALLARVGVAIDEDRLTANPIAADERVAILELGAPVLAELERLAGLSPPAFVDPDAGALQLPELPGLGALDDWVTVSSRCLAQDGDAARAFEVRGAMMRAAPHERSFTVLGLLAGIRWSFSAGSDLVELARHDAVTAESLRLAREALARSEPTPARAIVALQTEARMVIRSRDEVKEWLELPGGLGGTIYGDLYVDHEIAWASQSWIDFFGPDLTSWRELVAASERLAALEAGRDSAIVGTLLPSASMLTGVVARAGDHITSIRGFDVSLRAEEYRRLHGEYPPDAAALVTEFGPLPVDPRSETPLLYRRTEDGYRIEAVRNLGQTRVPIWPRPE